MMLQGPGIAMYQARFVRRSAPTEEMLIYTDGACLNNGQADPKAGCAFVFVPKTPGVGNPVTYGEYSFRLENRGPTGEEAPQTSNRAE
jgi:ribonuclease HI